MRTLSLNFVDIDNVYVDGSLRFNKPARDIESIHVPGRDGNLIVDYGAWQNVIITYPCFMKADDAATFRTNYNALINRLAGINSYIRLGDSGDADHYRMARPIVPQTPSIKNIEKRAYFDLSFDCKPQNFLRSGESTEGINAGSSKTLSNPSAQVARPELTANVTNGSGTFDIGGITVTLANVPGNGIVYIDCETMQCYGQGNVNMNPYVTFSTNDFPTLPAGDTVITVPAEANGGAARVTVKPRWWEL